MGTYAGDNAVWVDDVYQFEETDVVQGGPLGIDNVPLKNLADRTAWLRSQVGRMNRLEGEVYLDASGAIGNTLEGVLMNIYANGVNVVLALDDASTFRHGAILPFAAMCSPDNVAKITSIATPILNPDGTTVDKMYMHNNEQLLLAAMTTHFRVVNTSGNFYTAGEEVKGRKVVGNTLPLRGQILTRAAYPRLWAYANSLTMYQEITDEATWLSNPVNFRGLFSTGDGLTTFRLPDERGMHERMLDLGRGIDLTRTSNFAGSYEGDGVKAHAHTLDITLGDDGNGALPDDSGSGPVRVNHYITGVTGGAENTVKNIGKLHLIKY